MGFSVRDLLPKLELGWDGESGAESRLETSVKPERTEKYGIRIKYLEKWRSCRDGGPQIIDRIMLD